MKNAAGILLVIYLFFLVPLLAGALIDAAAGVKKRNISSTYANGLGQSPAAPPGRIP